MTQQWWHEPTAGDIVWCHFPDNIHPRPKPRPALVVTVFDDDAPRFTVRVAYGTSQRTTQLHAGEFAILSLENRVAYDAAGLSYDTKFDLRQLLDLPYSNEWFSVPPNAPHGQVPLLGTLHPSLVRAAAVAFRAAADR
ncbi:MAG: type II toxin-antitoxin system PemK/MazF family toxin [Ramlibacter sp.]